MEALLPLSLRNIISGAVMGALVVFQGPSGAFAGPYPQPVQMDAPSIAGAVPRLTRDRLADTLNAKDFGAVMDGTTDDSAAILRLQTAAQTLLSAGKNVEIVFPRGNLVTGSALTLSLPENIHLAIRGSMGFQFTTTGSNGAVSITQASGTNPSYMPHVELLQMAALKGPSAPSGGDAFFIQGAPPMVEVRTRGLRCYSPDSTTNFTSCFHGVNIERSEIVDTMFEGRGSGQGSPADGTAVWIGATQGLYSVDNHVRGLQGASLFAGVLATGHVEGLHIEHSNTIGMAYCVLAPGTTWPGSPTDATIDLIEYSDGHCSSTVRGVLSTGSSNKVHGIVFYNFQMASPPSGAYMPADAAALTGSASVSGYVAVDLLDANWSDVSHNEFQGPNATNSWGVHIGLSSAYTGSASASTEHVVVGNTFSVFKNGNISIDTGVTNGIVALNELRDGPTVSNSNGSIWVGLNRNPDNSMSVGGMSVMNTLITGGAFFGTDSTSGTTVTTDSTKGLHVLGNASGISTHMVLAPTTLSALQTSVPCTAANGGVEATVSDASSPTPGAALVGGGTTFAPAFCNGSIYIDR